MVGKSTRAERLLHQRCPLQVWSILIALFCALEWRCGQMHGAQSMSNVEKCVLSTIRQADCAGEPAVRLTWWHRVEDSVVCRWRRLHWCRRRRRWRVSRSMVWGECEDGVVGSDVRRLTRHSVGLRRWVCPCASYPTVWKLSIVGLGRWVRAGRHGLWGLHRGRPPHSALIALFHDLSSVEGSIEHVVVNK